MDDYQLAIDQLGARLAELDARLAAIAETAPYREPVGWLRCFRGIETLTAMLILAELHDVRRFASAPALMAYLGWCPGRTRAASSIDAAPSPEPAMPWSVGCWSKPRGIINTGQASASRSRGGAPGSQGE